MPKFIDISLIIPGEEFKKDEEISQDLLLDVANFMVHRVQYDPKKYGKRLTINNERYIKIKVYTEQISKTKKPFASSSTEKIGSDLLYKLLIGKDPQLICVPIHRKTEATALGYILSQAYSNNITMKNFCGVVNDLLAQRANERSTTSPNEESLLYSFFMDIIENKPDQAPFYFDVLDKFINGCPIRINKICDENKNTPLHTILAKKEERISRILIYILSYHIYAQNILNG